MAFWRSKHRSKIDQKSIKNRSKHEVNMGWRLGTDFFEIFMDFGRQVGSENPIRSDQIRSDQVRSGQSTARQGKTKQRQVSQAKSVRSGQATKAVDHFPPISLDKGGVPPTNKDVSSPGVRNRWAPRGWDFELRLFGHLVALLFFIVFSMPFLIDFGSILPPNLAPKIHQNR